MDHTHFKYIRGLRTDRNRVLDSIKLLEQIREELQILNKQEDEEDNARDPELRLAELKEQEAELKEVSEGGDDWIVNTFLDNFFKVIFSKLHGGLIS